MRGLANIPSTHQLEQAYARLQLHSECATENEHALFSQWSRLDPRLAEIWVKAIACQWTSLNPMKFREQLLEQPWPNAAGVLLDYAAALVHSSDKKLFLQWRNFVLEGVKAANSEQFFIGQRAIGGKEMILDAAHSLSEYKKWGYLSREVPINKASPDLFHRDYETRMIMLESLLSRLQRITTQQYLEALGGGITRRQAERDLQSCQKLKAVGNTKARVYRVK